MRDSTVVRAHSQVTVAMQEGAMSTPMLPGLERTGAKNPAFLRDPVRNPAKCEPDMEYRLQFPSSSPAMT